MRWRLTWFATAILAVAVAIVWAAWATWGQARDLNHRLSTVRVESFEIADHFQAIIYELDQTLRTFQNSRSPTDWEKFVRESEELNRWISQQTQELPNAKEIDVLVDIKNAYSAYLKVAGGVTNAAAANDTVRLSKLMRRAETQSRDMIDLGNRLAKEHRKLVDDLLMHAEQSLPAMQQLIFGLLLVLLGLGAWVAVVVYRDMISPLRVELLETQRQMERHEKLASLGILAAGVAHEIRNPLTAIKARLFTQQKRLSAGSPEAEDAAVIKDEINRLDRIVRDVLQFARPAEPRLGPIAVQVPLRRVHELLGAQLEKNGIDLRVEAAGSLEITADPEQLQQVLINLVQNAADSIGQGGAITLRARPGPPRPPALTRPTVILEVQDTGRGIPPEVQKRLFDPFFTTKASGAGLGLAIAARIVEKHGGWLEFRTELNRGSTFAIVLPACVTNESSR